MSEEYENEAYELLHDMKTQTDILLNMLDAVVGISIEMKRFVEAAPIHTSKLDEKGELLKLTSLITSSNAANLKMDLLRLVQVHRDYVEFAMKVFQEQDEKEEKK